jgi:hypothetical protein
MNFVKHLKDIQNDLFKKNKFPGCYVYSRLKDDNTFKLGMSEKDLFKRVKDAKFCFPEKNTFFIHMFIVCHEKKNVRTIEKKLLAESKDLQKIKSIQETEILEQGIRSTEYRITLNRKTLGEAVKTVLQDNRTLWDEVVVFGDKGWDIHKRSIKSLAISKSKRKDGIQATKPIKVGDKVFVLYLEKPIPIFDNKGKLVRTGGIPMISEAGKVLKKNKTKYEVYWNDYNGSPFKGKYPFNEVYKLKKEAVFAKKYWYTDIDK